MQWSLVLRSAAFLLFLGSVVGSIVLLLDKDLVKHMVAHVLLVEFGAVGLVLSLPPLLKRRFVKWVDESVSSGGISGFLALLTRSPLFLLALWTVVLTATMTPTGHNLALTPSGRILEPLLLFLTGFLYWRATFDQHEPLPIVRAMTRGGLPWWGRHVFAMFGRITVLPAIMMMWLTPNTPYYGANHAEQTSAVSVVLGTEMSIFCLTFVLWFVFMIVEGDRERQKELANDLSETT